MREKIGADTIEAAGLLGPARFHILIEDPATIWHLGPQRYPQIPRRYQALTPPPKKLADRYQHRRAVSGRISHQASRPGSELFALLHLASAAFPRVARLLRELDPCSDLPLLPSARPPSSVRNERRVKG